MKLVIQETTEILASKTHVLNDETWYAKRIHAYRNMNMKGALECHLSKTSTMWVRALARVTCRLSHQINQQSTCILNVIFPSCIDLIVCHTSSVTLISSSPIETIKLVIVIICSLHFQLKHFFQRVIVMSLTCNVIKPTHL